MQPPRRKPRNPFVFVPSMALGKFDVLGDVIRAFDTYGDIYQYTYKGKQHYMLRDPEHISQVLIKHHAQYEKEQDYKDDTYGLVRFFGRGLLTSDGSYWKQQRQAIQPAFHHKRIEAYANLMREQTLKHIETWLGGDIVDMRHEMWNLTLKIIVEALFTFDLGADAPKVGTAIDIIQAYILQSQFIDPRIPTLASLRAKRASQWLDETVSKIIDQRLTTHAVGEDLLSTLLQLEDENGSLMNRQQLRDEIITLIFAGHETSANALTWLWYLLAQHPHIEHKLYKEIEEVLANRPPALADLNNLPYLNLVVQEAMRLYPPAYYIGRSALIDTSIGEYTVPKGTGIGIAIFAVHRDPRWWDQPTKFFPERWQDIHQDSRSRTYLPFGVGPRVCIGISFASIEIRLLLATIVQQFTMVLLNQKPVLTDPAITLRPRGSVKISIHRRL